MKARPLRTIVTVAVLLCTPACTQRGTLDELIAGDGLQLPEQTRNLLAVNMKQQATLQEREYGGKLVAEDGATFYFDKESKQVHSFFRLVDTDGDADAPREVQVDADSAMPRAKALAHSLGAGDLDFGTAMVKLTDSRGQPLKWFISVPRFIDGFPSTGYFQVEISAESGEILSMKDIPLILPEALAQNVSQEDAESIARAYAHSKGVNLKQSITSDQHIIYPNNSWTRGSDDNYESSCRVRLAWVVESGGDCGSCQRYQIYIDSETGNVIGGLR
jgi:hypothetical protein